MVVHEPLLCMKSEYFRKTLQTGFKEGVDREIKLPDDDPEVIAAFLAWVYTNNLDHLDPDDVRSSDRTLQLYRFADKICLIPLQNSCLDHMITIFQSVGFYLDWTWVREHYENSRASDGLRKLLVDLKAECLLSWPGASLRWKLNSEELNNEMMVDVICRMNEIASSGKTYLKPTRERGYYHVALE